MAEFYVDISTTNTGTGHSGLPNDPLSFDDFVTRADYASGTGDASDVYYVRGEKQLTEDVGIGLFNSMLPWDKNTPWVVYGNYFLVIDVEHVGGLKISGGILSRLDTIVITDGAGFNGKTVVIDKMCICNSTYNLWISDCRIDVVRSTIVTRLEYTGTCYARWTNSIRDTLGGDSTPGVDSVIQTLKNTYSKGSFLGTTVNLGGNDLSWAGETSYWSWGDPTFSGFTKKLSNYNYIDGYGAGYINSWANSLNTMDLDYDVGLYGNERDGIGAFYFNEPDPNQTGGIGAFYFGPIEAEINIDAAVAAFGAQTPATTEGKSTIVAISQAPIFFFKGQLPIVVAKKDLDISFTATPRVGTSPLVVDFVATVVFNGEAASLYEVNEYYWYFDYSGSPSTYEKTTSPTTTHVYTGYKGKKFAVKLAVTIKRKF